MSGAFPQVDEMRAAGFTTAQILLLQRIIAVLQGQTLGNIETVNKLMDRLKPDVWLS